AVCYATVRRMVVAFVTLEVLTPLCGYAAGASQVALAAASVRDALCELERAHPGLHRSICDETGAIRRHINVFVNDAHIRERAGLHTPLAPGDVVIVLPAISGG